jgi:D-mannonate dehydratase
MVKEITNTYQENCLRFCHGQIGLAREREDILIFISVLASHLGIIVGNMNELSNDDVDKICYNLENIFIESASNARVNKMKK